MDKQNLSKKRLPELLSPAGSFDAAVAAVKAGADAIYLGGRMLNARMNAKNFDDEQIAECVRYCHKYGVRVYVTLNTAVLDRELPEVIAYADMLYEIGVDALIVSDLGLVREISTRYPEMELHASTQASGHNAECAKIFKKIGFRRMVCARELSSHEIDSLCKDSPIEIEQFIHGAMCVSQSGQCLASAMMGGRSGNRGECAQPCRMCYSGEYPLSLKDMCLAQHIPELIASGVASLKIEGRMKSPAYVYEVTRIYRTLLDEGRNASEEEMDKLKAVFSRGGFSDGYFVGKRDSTMNGVRSESDISASREIKTDFTPIKRDIPQIIVAPRQKPEEYITLKAAKRPDKKAPKPIYTARFVSPDQIRGEGFFDHIYLPLDKFISGSADGIVMPPSVFPADEKKTESLLEKAVENGASHVLITHVGQIELCQKYGLILHGDYRLNVFNTPNAKLLTDMGLRDIILSPELTLPRMRDLSAPKSAIVYGRVPLMLLTKPIAKSSLRDKTGATFKLIPDAGRQTLLNSVPFYMADKAKQLDENGIRGRHMIFTTESAKEVSEIIESYKKGSPSKASDFRRIQTK